MDARFSTLPPSPDDLLVLLAVARAGRYTTAAQQLGVTHTTIARRIASLESALGGPVLRRGPAGWMLTPLGERAVAVASEVESAMGRLTGAEPGGELAGLIRLSATDGFSGYIAAPAMAELRARHPQLALEIVAVTRQASRQRAAADLEVVVGRPEVRRAEAVKLADYVLGLYASRELLERIGTPESPSALTGKPLVYFIESMLHVDSLDDARRTIPAMFDAVTSTNVYVHVEATRAGAGFGLLPCFLADRHPDLVRLFPDRIARTLPYWLVARSDTFRQPAIEAFVGALRERLRHVQSELLGTATGAAAPA
ncbi:LysR family transcriptional regulator [Protaetiibacter sp. SSC-01]|uniref:LysR family transcriptional regulator n=1 Tax=Protaetiibacter sp. SSC-01 TaxID=2759943 RepID=UPI001657041D|nr:LysR family transcriptional regulator [Protaetiibacter sp. SSC-01]QNO38559.1 LysR family transcriptional regulator [Protaetiibacter sp. SSC-01]